MLKTKNYLIGESEFLNEIYTHLNKPFSEESKVFNYYNSKEFSSKNNIERNKIINDNLIEFIKNDKSLFCLLAVVNYLEYISKMLYLMVLITCLPLKVS